MLLWTRECRSLFMIQILFSSDIYPEVKLLWKVRYKRLSWRFVCLAKILVLLRRYIYLGWLKVSNGNHGDYITLLNFIYIPLVCANTMCSSKPGLEKWTQQKWRRCTWSLLRFFQVPTWIDSFGNWEFSPIWSWYCHQIAD